MLVGIMGLSALWGMIAKEDGYDFGGFEWSTFLLGAATLGIAGLLALACWGLFHKYRWAAALGLGLCGLGLLAGVTTSSEWITHGEQAVDLKGPDLIRGIALIGILIIGSIVEAVMLVRILMARPT